MSPASGGDQSTYDGDEKEHPQLFHAAGVRAAPTNALGHRGVCRRPRIAARHPPPLSPDREDGYTYGYGNAFQGVRAYDSTMAQWTAPDAYAGDVHDPMSQKPFMWNNNNPLDYEDPSGYCPICIVVFVIYLENAPEINAEVQNFVESSGGAAGVGGSVARESVVEPVAASGSHDLLAPGANAGDGVPIQSGTRPTPAQQRAVNAQAMPWGVIRAEQRVQALSRATGSPTISLPVLSISLWARPGADIPIACLAIADRVALCGE